MGAGARQADRPREPLVPGPDAAARRVARRRACGSAPTTTAARLYTGVLYAALDIATLPRGAARNIVISRPSSARCGRPTECPPTSARWTRRYWRAGLAAALDEAAAGRLIVDCRSATYVAAWRPSRESRATRVQLAVVEEVDGVRRVVSHMAKKTRGEVARHLLVSGARPRTPAELASAVGEQFAASSSRRSGPAGRSC